MRLPNVAALDLLSSLLCVFVAFTLLLAVPTKNSDIETLGFYAVSARWPDGYASDVDLYVASPDGTIVYFSNSDSGSLFLDHDDLGGPDKLNYERALIRQLLPGEYVVNVHSYNQWEKTIPVTVELWRLRGTDKLLYRTTVVLTHKGQETTAFRFRPPRRITHLSAELVG